MNPAMNLFQALPILLLATVGRAQVTVPQHTKADITCGDRPADVIFIMDSSSSIKSRDFQKQLEFVKGVVEYFDIGVHKTQVGALSFSNWAFLEFHLNAHLSRWGVQHALSKIDQVKGDTNTADAIAFARDIMFKMHNGARPTLPNIAIVLTDGKSNNPTRTAQEAARARDEGIHVFAIGIGNEVERAELEAIASQPTDNYVFQVGDYTALQYIREILAIKTCEVSQPPPTPTPTIAIEPACGDHELADIVFAPAPAASAENTEKALAFFREVAAGFDIDNDRVRVGLVPKDCDALPELTLEEYTDKDIVMEQLDDMIDSLPATASQIKYMRRTSFRKRNGARSDAHGLAVMLVDSGDDLSRAKYEALKLKGMRGVELFVIGVGKNLKTKKLKALASEPSERHVFHVESYNELPRLIYKVKNSMCPDAGL